VSGSPFGVHPNRHSNPCSPPHDFAVPCRTPAGLLAPLAAGGAVVLPAAGRFTAHSFWRDACEHGATYYTAVPTIHQVSG
jgi:acyl-CoA synthetase (AMP-forming)/AMP-acid ligase II